MVELLIIIAILVILMSDDKPMNAMYGQKVKLNLDKIKYVAFNNLSKNSQDILQFMNCDIAEELEAYKNIGEKYSRDGEFMNEMSEELLAMSEEVEATIEQITDALQDTAKGIQNSSDHQISFHSKY